MSREFGVSSKGIAVGDQEAGDHSAQNNVQDSCVVARRVSSSVASAWFAATRTKKPEHLRKTGKQNQKRASR